MTNQEKMQLTLEYAKEALEKREMPIAAIIFKGDEIIAKAYTSEYTDGRFLVHAEIKALIEADKLKPSYKDRQAMQLFVTLEPCMMCLGASLSFFLGEIHYAVDAPEDGGIKFLGDVDKSLVVPKVYSGMMKDECMELYKTYISVAPNSAMKSFAENLITGA